MPRRKLPVLAEHTLTTVASARVELADNFDRTVHKIAREEGLPVMCRSGCSNCCYHPVHLSIVEGVLLYRFLVSRGRWTPSFRATVEVHANRTRDLPYEIWLLSVIPCPMLDETTKKCTAYEGRPYQCRVTYSTSDPNDCHPHLITQSGIVSRKETMAAFHERVNMAIRRHGITMIIMPLSVAVLVGEKIVNGEFDLDGADMAILKDYAEHAE